MGSPFRTLWGERLREGGAAEMGLSALLHGALLFMFATALASLDVSEREGMTRDDVEAMRGYLRAGAERTSNEDREGEDEVSPRGEALSGGAPGLGDPRVALSRAIHRSAHAAAEGLREDALREARSFGVIGLLASGAVPEAAGVWDARGGDGAIGAMWGGVMDGSGGDLLLAGTGAGGGGRGEGIGIGTIGTIGHCGASTCAGFGQGFVGGHGKRWGAHVTTSPVLRCGDYLDKRGVVHETCTATVNGRLPPEVVQRVIRQNYGRFRLCYEQGLRPQPALSGRVEVKFVIGRDGTVVTAADGASDLPDPQVRACIVRAFAGLSFPEPEGGIVTVVYPLLLTPE